MGGTQTAPGRPRLARPGSALAVGVLTVLMLAATAVLSSMALQPLFDGLSHALSRTLGYTIVTGVLVGL